MFVGALKLDLRILESRSLKDKRMVLRRIKDRVRERLGLVVVEVGAQELWQRAELGVACASGERAKVGALLDDVRRCVVSTEGTSLLREWRDVSSFAGQAVDLAEPPDAADREGPADDALGDDGRAGGGDGWIPAQWQQALDAERQDEPGELAGPAAEPGAAGAQRSVGARR